MSTIDKEANASSITHHTSSIVNDIELTKKIVHSIKERLVKTTELEIPIFKALELVDQLAEFELGRFLLHNQSMNGYWTAYIFRNVNNGSVHPLENWLLNRSLLVRARERFYRFQHIMQRNLRSNMKLASIPCGLMDDLLTLNYSGFQNISLVGIDLDNESLQFAKENAIARGLLDSVKFLEQNAWEIEIENEYDLIISNGLNMYQKDFEKNIELYKCFYDALKKNGLLIISFLPPPPNGTDPNYTWANFDVNLEDLKRERTIFGVILQAKFLNFCTESDMVRSLESVGFKIEEINYNSKRVLPIAVARK